jgi:hypothetical protein
MKIQNLKKGILFIILLVFTDIAYSQKQEKDSCPKCFKKEKKSKRNSSLFSSDSLFLTKPFLFYANGNRELFIQFKRSNENNMIVVRQQTPEKSLKRAIVLGVSIKIGIHFEGGGNYVLTFKSNQNEKKVGSYNFSSNEANIDSTLNDLLKTKNIIKIELLNPFDNIQQNIVRSKVLSKKRANKIRTCYNCFLNKRG